MIMILRAAYPLYFLMKLKFLLKDSLSLRGVHNIRSKVHEPIGHNLNLSHSTEGSNSYGDISGMMGKANKQHDGQKKCFM